MVQNLCLICCYTFQKKRNRFISDESRECVQKFGNELGFPLYQSLISSSSQSKLFTNNYQSGSLLDLPVGECITICGDCLSLIVVYVHTKSVQSEKEKRLLQLQKQVCQTIKELSEVVHDVQCNINKLQGTVRMGDETRLDQFMKCSSSSGSLPPTTVGDVKTEIKSFRDKVLSSLNPGVVTKPSKEFGDTNAEPLFIKAEPLNEDFNDDVSSFCGDLEDLRTTFREDTSSFRNDSPDMSTEIIKTENSASPLSAEKRKQRTVNMKPLISCRGEACLPADEDANEDITEFSDCDTAGQNYDDCHLHGADSGSGSNFSSDVETPKAMPKRSIIFSKRKRGRGRPKTLAGAGPLSLKRMKYGPILCPEQAQKWKEALFNRVVLLEEEHLNNSTQYKSQPASVDSLTATPYSRHQLNNNNSTKCILLVNDKLHFRGIAMQVHAKHRALECMRCGKKFFEERDITNNEIKLEVLMCNHIVLKHFPPKKKKLVEEMEVVEYTCHTKNKLTYKLACKNKYTYTRRCERKEVGTAYFRCDFRKGNCSASIVLKDGKYIKLRRGWNEDGYHTVHVPDVDRTNRQIAVGNAKYMYLTDNSKTIDEVLNAIMSEHPDGENPTIPIERLKRRMVYSKYGTRGMAPEEKLNQSWQCSSCGKIYKERRHLSRHMKTHNNNNKVLDGGDNSSISNKPPALKTDPVGKQEPALKQQDVSNFNPRDPVACLTTLTLNSR